MRAISHGPLPGRRMRSSWRAAIYAVLLAGVVLIAGGAIAARLDDGSFAALGLAAVTLLILAPIAAFVGALVAYWPLRRAPLDANARFVLMRGGILLGFATAAVYFIVDRPLAVTVLALGSAVLVILATALAERTS